MILLGKCTKQEVIKGKGLVAKGRRKEEEEKEEKVEELETKGENLEQPNISKEE